MFYAAAVPRAGDGATATRSAVPASGDTLRAPALKMPPTASGVVHALSMVPIPSIQRGAVGKGWATPTRCRKGRCSVTRKPWSRPASVASAVDTRAGDLPAVGGVPRPRPGTRRRLRRRQPPNLARLTPDKALLLGRVKGPLRRRDAIRSTKHRPFHRRAGHAKSVPRLGTLSGCQVPVLLRPVGKGRCSVTPKPWSRPGWRVTVDTRAGGLPPVAFRRKGGSLADCSPPCVEADADRESAYRCACRPLPHPSRAARWCGPGRPRTTPETRASRQTRTSTAAATALAASRAASMLSRRASATPMRRSPWTSGFPNSRSCVSGVPRAAGRLP